MLVVMGSEEKRKFMLLRIAIQLIGKGLYMHDICMHIYLIGPQPLSVRLGCSEPSSSCRKVSPDTNRVYKIEGHFSTVDLNVVV